MSAHGGYAISQWKKQLVEALPEVFSRRREHNRKAEEALKDRPADAGSASSSSCFVAKCLYFAE